MINIRIMETRRAKRARMIHIRSMETKRAKRARMTNIKSMETRRAKKVRLTSKDIKSDVKNTDGLFNVHSLPAEILIQIFRNLNYYDLSRAARVCKKWHEVTRCPVFWKQVDIQFSPENGSMSKRAIKFIGALPPHVTHLRLDFEYSRDWILDIKELMKKLHANCPDLEVLIFHRARFSDKIKVIFHLSEKHLANIRVLALHHALLKNMTVITLFKDCPAKTSKIEVVDISRSYGIVFDNSLLSNLVHLKKISVARTFDWDFLLFNKSIVSHLEILDLEGTFCRSSEFQMICKYAHHLVELYICFSWLRDSDLMFNESDNFLPCLKIICLRGSYVTYKGVSSLVKSCPNIDHVYISNLHRDPSIDFGECLSKKVQVIHSSGYCNHYAKTDYMCV